MVDDAIDHGEIREEGNGLHLSEIIQEANVGVRMRDGVKLATNIYRPKAEGKFAVILVRTPYKKEMGELQARAFASLKEARVVAYTYYPLRKTNIYATKLESVQLFENKNFEDIFRSLKSGFYYLWLPQASR
jgi:predicted acyl esterase